MSSSYIPAKDSQFAVWLLNFSTLLSASPGTYGLVSADATAVASVQSAWQTAYNAATDGSTRGPATISAKNVARVNALAVVRPYAQQIANNAGVDVNDKLAIGVNTRQNPGTPVPPPSTQPILSLIAGTPLNMQFRFRDAGAPAASRAKPADAAALQLFGVTSATVISDPSTLPLIGTFTKVPVNIAWDSADQGKTAYIAARWINRKGQPGPFCAIQAIVVM